MYKVTVIPLYQNDGYSLMEATGVEPVSENISHKLSPGAVGLLRFPSLHGGLQPYRVGSFMIHKQSQSFPCCVHRKI